MQLPIWSLNFTPYSVFKSYVNNFLIFFGVDYLFNQDITCAKNVVKGFSEICRKYFLKHKNLHPFLLLFSPFVGAPENYVGKAPYPGKLRAAEQDFTHARFSYRLYLGNPGQEKCYHQDACDP